MKGCNYRVKNRLLRKFAMCVVATWFGLAFCPMASADSSGWHNSANAFDASGDGLFAPDDLVIVVNETLFPTIANLDGSLPDVATPPPFVDINNDCFATPLDWLTMVNEIYNNGSILNGPPANVSLQPSEVIIRLRVRDLDGNLIQQTNVGSTVMLEATIQDVDEDSISAFAG